jgi:hypothetical protein
MKRKLATKRFKLTAEQIKALRPLLSLAQKNHLRGSKGCVVC